MVGIFHVEIVTRKALAKGKKGTQEKLFSGKTWNRRK